LCEATAVRTPAPGECDLASDGVAPPSITGRPAPLDLDVVAAVDDVARAVELPALLGATGLGGARVVLVDVRTRRDPPLPVGPGVEVLVPDGVDLRRRAIDHARLVATAPWVLALEPSWRPAPWRFATVAADIVRTVLDAAPSTGLLSGRQPAAASRAWSLQRLDDLAMTAPAGTMAAQAVLFDRDGTLVDDVPYNGDPERVTLRPGAADAVAVARSYGLRVGLVSNQSGVGRGLLTLDQVHDVNGRVAELVGGFDVVRICPHHPAVWCGCRKPRPGMVLDAARSLGVDPRATWMVGDIGADVQAAHRAGARAVLVPTSVTRPDEVELAPVVCATVLEAVRHVLGAAASRPAGSRRG
jgi:histidinol-phosphate phosphatase family protein